MYCSIKTNLLQNHLHASFIAIFMARILHVNTGWENTSTIEPIFSRVQATLQDALPVELTIGEIIEFWSGNYERLNEDEYYIHWLFPNKDRGRNKYAYPITNEEIEVIKNNPVLIHRFMTAFDMMLDFFGMERKNIQFLIASESRLSDMNKYTKNYIKISRILKSLRLFGLEGIWENWLNFLLELIDSGKLHNARACYNEFWIKT